MNNGKTMPRPVPEPTKMTKPFWQAARNRKLVIQFDPDGGSWQFYPRHTSIQSGRRNLEWREVSGRGWLYSFSITHVPPPGFEDRDPYLIGVVELDEGVRMMTPLMGIAPGEARIGMRVQVCWEEMTDDIIYFAFEPEN